MKNLTKFIFIGAVVTAFGAAFAIQGCAGGIGNCTTDTDCGAGQTCDTTQDPGVCVGGEGEGEGEGGGGEGEGAACNDEDTGLGAGTGLNATDANLTASADDSECTSAGTNACDAITGTTCFSFDVTVDGDAAEADAINGNNASWITWAVDGEDANDAAGTFTENFCNGSAVGCADDGNGNVICACGMCLGGPPANLAVQVSDGTQDSNGQCVAL